jgi:hypothetical protein
MVFHPSNLDDASGAEKRQNTGSLSAKATSGSFIFGH